MFNLFSLLAGPLSWIMQLIYNIVGSYGWTIIIITILVRLIMFPLSIKQEKSRAKTAAYQPMIKEIQNKWKNDKNRQNQEVMKFQQENNIKMTAGCLPMLINMIVLFGIIAVIQSPLKYMLSVPTEQIEAGISIVQEYKPELDINKKPQTSQSILIGEIINNDISQEKFLEGVEVTDKDGNTTLVKMDKEYVEKIADYKFDFMGLNLAKVPDIGFNVYILLPILSVVTQFASQFIMMWLNKKQQENQPGGQATMWIMTVVMGVFFGFYAFTVPVGFSLYYTASNIVMTIQQLVLRKIHDPEKVRQEVEAEIEARRQEKKSKKKVVVRNAEGKKEVKELSEADLNKLRLAKAREQDQEKYSDDKDAKEDGSLKGKEFEELKEIENAGEEKVLEEKNDSPEEIVDEAIKTVKEEKQETKAEKKQAEEYKPGRRKRAKENKKATPAEDKQEKTTNSDEESK